MSLLALFVPASCSALCIAADCVVSLVMSLFSVGICCEKHYLPASVIAANIAIYVLACGVTRMLLALAVQHLQTDVVWQIFALVATFAALAAVPVLPGGYSGAVVFTLKKYPENESTDERRGRVEAEFAEQHGLTVREKEVFHLVLQGAPHKEVAQQLAISSWTVRDYMSNIYKKTQAHSAKELIAMVNEGV